MTTELQFGSAFQLLCATLLSAQCTDKRINAITPELFKHYPDARLMAQATPEEVYEYIKSVSYPNAKAHHLVEMSKMLVSDYGGEVPSEPDLLMRLPGVGRKTANVLQAVWFGKATMAVDTHVYRVSHRLGLVPATANTPRKVEDYLMRHIPEADIPDAHHWSAASTAVMCARVPSPCATNAPSTTSAPRTSRAANWHSRLQLSANCHPTPRLTHIKKERE